MNIIIWGAGNYGRSAYLNLNKYVEICGIFDSDKERIGEDFYGQNINDIHNLPDNYDVILMCAANWESMYVLAKEIGIDDDKLYIWDGKTRIKKEEAYAAKVHSQDGEELFLREQFRDVRSGFYVDVGAYHPLKYSNTLWAYNLGWKGINIEPNTDNFHLFNLMRPNDININAGISNSRSKMKYYQFDEAALNTFDKDRATMLCDKYDYKLTNCVDVDVLPLQDILDQYNITHIDYMDIDVEGKELEVLKSINYDRVQIQYLLIEQLQSDLKSVLNSEIAGFLEIYGFSPVSKFDRTVIYHNNGVKNVF